MNATEIIGLLGALAATSALVALAILIYWAYRR